MLWATDPLPDHLRIRMRIVDANNSVLTTGRDVATLQHELRDRISAGFANLPHDLYNRSGITSWDFGDLPQHITLETQQGTLVGYPALIDETQSVALRVLPEQAAAQQAHAIGLRRLFMLRLAGELKYLGRSLARGRSWCGAIWAWCRCAR